jgi:succinate dehydrogenase/fumarate reductase flavoprotein subunit
MKRLDAFSEQVQFMMTGIVRHLKNTSDLACSGNCIAYKVGRGCNGILHEKKGWNIGREEERKKREWIMTQIGGFI